MASQGGRPENPQWYCTLVANPDTHIEIGAERARLWPRPVATYADFDTYQSWTEREIPVVMLHPRASQSTD